MPQSHTSTQQWQSFELRMRQRRVDRCLQRARTALATRRIRDAEDALAEARALDPENADATVLVAQVPLVAARARAKRVLARRAAGIAVVLLIALAGAAGWMAMRSPDAPQTAADTLTASRAAVTPFAQPAVTTPAAIDTALAPVDTVPAPIDPAPLEADGLPAAEAAAVDADAPASRAADDGASVPDLPSTRPAPPVRADPPPSPVTEPPSRPAGTAGTDRSASVAARGTAAASSPTQQTTAAASRTPDATQPPPVISQAAPVPPIQSERLEPPVVVPELPAVALDLSSPGARGEPLPALSTPPPAPAREAPVPAINHEGRVRAVLNRYQAAYNDLDANAAGGVWPTVDTRALARAFEGLTSQRVSLGTCDVQIRGTAATADCRGQARWTPRVGGGTQSASRRWRFELAQKGEDWVITQATVR